jgi:hypothetical protein
LVFYHFAKVLDNAVGLAIFLLQGSAGSVWQGHAKGAFYGTQEVAIAGRQARLTTHSWVVMYSRCREPQQKQAQREANIRGEDCNLLLLARGSAELSSQHCFLIEE